MRYVTGDMWQLAATHLGFVVVTTNCCIRSDNKAVMGAGIAKDAAIKFPNLPVSLGKHIATLGEQLYIEYPVICLPTKTDWRLRSDLALIERGCIQLAMLGRAFDDIDSTTCIYLPKLGCGLGGLDWEKQVRPVVDSILDSDRFVLVSI